MPVTITKDGVADLLAALKTLRQQEVLVGIPRESAAREPEPGEKGEPIDNAALGYIHETGAPEANIPARPFLIPGVEGVQDRIAETMKRAAGAVLAGRLKEGERGLVAVGLMAQAAVQQKIVDGTVVPLAPQTIANRLAHGRTGTKPLIDTGALRQAITYVVLDKQKRDR